MNTKEGYSKLQLNNNYVLTSDGGHKAISDLSVKNADTLDGYHESSFVKQQTIAYRNDYENIVILLWKDSKQTYHFLNGKIYTYDFGSIRNRICDVNLWFSRWSTGYDLNLSFNTYSLGTRLKLITCTYNNEKWWAILHYDNISSCYIDFFGVYKNIEFKKIIYYNSKSKEVLNLEIYNSIEDLTSKLKTFYVGGIKNALMSDIPTKVSLLTNDSGYIKSLYTLTLNSGGQAVTNNNTYNASSAKTYNIPLATQTSNANTYGVVKGNLSGSTNSGSWANCKVIDGVIYYYDRANDGNSSVSQTNTSDSNWRPILLSDSGSTSEVAAANNCTGGSYINSYLKYQASTQTLYSKYLKGEQLTLTAKTGTSPLIVSSTTRVDNLNAQYLNGYNSDLFLKCFRNINYNAETTENGSIPILLFALMGNGKKLKFDPEFYNRTADKYSNAGSNSKLTITKGKATDFGLNNSGNISNNVCKFVVTGNDNPGYGGFYSGIKSKANSIFVLSFRALLPNKYYFSTATNSLGNNFKITWITNNRGTGKWEWYGAIILCGNTGIFNNGGYVYVSKDSDAPTPTDSSPLVWYLAYEQVTELTNTLFDVLNYIYKNECNFIQPYYSNNIWFNYRDKVLTNTSTISAYNFGNGLKNYAEIIAAKFKVNKGTSSQFLKADGSLDSNKYLTSSDSLKNPNAIKFKNINGTEVSYDGSSAVDLTTGTYVAKLPYGFNSWASGCKWGNTTGTSFASWNDSTGGSIDFRRDNPSSGKMSIKVDGRIYVNEGNNPVISSEYGNGYWALRTPDGGNDWIRTSNSGIIPYTSGGSTAGHSSLGTSGWYFASAYIQNVYGSLKGNADSASIATSLQTSRNLWGNSFDGTADVSGTLHLPVNTVGINFRGPSLNSSWSTWVSHQLTGNEALVFGSQSVNTPFMFINGESYANVSSSRYQSLTPALSIRNNTIQIGYPFSDFDSTYKLRVNGSAKASSFYSGGFHHTTNDSNDYIILAGGGTKALSDLTTHKHGLLHTDFTQTINTATGGWQLINSTYNGFILKSLRTETNAPSWIEKSYASGIAFGGADTKGVLSVAYDTPAIKLAGGNGTAPVWWIEITGTKEKSYNLNSFITSVENKNATIDWNTETTIATIGGTDIKVKIPKNPNTWRPINTSYALITKGDNRNVNDAPNTYKSVFHIDGLKTNTVIGKPSNDTYSGLISFATLIDSASGYPWQIAFNNSGINVRRATSDTVWGSWKKLFDYSNNILFDNADTEISVNPLYYDGLMLTSYDTSCAHIDDNIWVPYAGSDASDDGIVIGDSGSNSSSGWQNCKIVNGVVQYYNIPNTDYKVTCGNQTANADFRVALAGVNDNTVTSSIAKSNKLLFNPSSGNLTVSGEIQSTQIKLKAINGSTITYPTFFADNSKINSNSNFVFRGYNYTSSISLYDAFHSTVYDNTFKPNNFIFKVYGGYSNTDAYIKINKFSAKDTISATTTISTGQSTFAGNVLSTGFYQSSDIRYKNILKKVKLTSEQIATLPMFTYKWKNREDSSIYVGTSAQSVEKLLKELVTTDNDFKSLNYATFATVSSISLAREIVKLKQRIKQLENELYSRN